VRCLVAGIWDQQTRLIGARFHHDALRTDIDLRFVDFTTVLSIRRNARDRGGVSADSRPYSAYEASILGILGTRESLRTMQSMCRVWRRWSYEARLDAFSAASRIAIPKDLTVGL
jgi:hypothetical protein